MGRYRQFLAIAAITSMPQFSSASTLSISDITSTDELGYECVAGEYFEETGFGPAIAFAASEKIRLPRTCLPEPCNAALTPRELSNVTGTEMILARFDDEWNEYYARYADHCRKETVDTMAGADDPISTDDFWAPLVEEPTVVAGISTSNIPVVVPLTVSSGGSSSGSADNTENSVVPTTGTVFTSVDDDEDGSTTGSGVSSSTGDSGSDSNDGSDVSSVPIPASLVLLGSASALLLRRRRS